MKKCPPRFKRIVGGILFATLAYGVAFAALAGHPQLAKADRHAAAALIELGQARNGASAFGGHRARANQLLRQARVQMRRAAIYADHHHG